MIDVFTMISKSRMELIDERNMHYANSLITQKQIKKIQEQQELVNPTKEPIEQTTIPAQ
jgi:hypothetical protein